MVLVEVIRKAYLASIVPVIVNAILNEHQLVVDIIAFVSKGDFPRSRLGEKQRGKILASWVTRKLRTIAQFGIRDPDGADSQITEVPEDHTIGVPSLQKGSMTLLGNSPEKSVETSPHGVEHDFAPLPTGISEMPANYENSIMESPPLPSGGEVPQREEDAILNLPNHTSDSIDQSSRADDDSPAEILSGYYQGRQGDPGQTSRSELPAFNYNASPPTPRYDSKPSIFLPSPTGHDTVEAEGDLWSLPSQQQHQSRYASSSGNSYSRVGLRVANAGPEDDEDGHPHEAVMHMNLAGVGSQRSWNESEKGEGRYDGSGYGDAL